jgi:peptide/nickel transport system permease protein
MMPLFRFIFKRACYSAAVILAVLTIVWVIVNQIGDPVRLLLPVEAGPELIAATRMKFGLDDPMAERFLRDLTGWLQGDFGNSLWQGVPALPLVLDRLPNTILLSFATWFSAFSLLPRDQTSHDQFQQDRAKQHRRP